MSGNIYVGQGNVKDGPTDAIYKMQTGKLSDLLYPGPAETWLFMDEHPDSINDAGLFPPHQTSWIDVPATYHNGACGVGFADGHAEIHKWIRSLASGPARAVTYADIVTISTGANDPDVHWVSYRTPRLSTVSY